MLDSTQTGPQDNNVEAPKDNQPNRVASPPPAYAPPPITTIPLTLPQITALRIRRAEAQAAYRNSVTTSSMDVEFENCEADIGLVDEEDTSSPICLRINTSVNITKSNNVVCLSDTPPADYATAIANAVVKCLQENSSGNCGIPMIDEEGRPRPIKIEVDASTLVEGSGNIVGNESIINKFVRNRNLRRLRGDSDDDEEEDDEQEDAASPPKRRRVSVAE